MTPPDPALAAEGIFLFAIATVRAGDPFPDRHSSEALYQGTTLVVPLKREKTLALALVGTSEAVCDSFRSL
jgi:hypothetical protein